MKLTLAVSFYKYIINICSVLIGGLTGFLMFGVAGSLVGAGLGVVFGKFLEKNILKGTA